MRKFRGLRWINILLLVYLLSGLSIYIFQERIIFHPVKVEKDHAYGFPYPNKELNIQLDENSSINVVQFFSPGSIRKGLVIYFHGNGANIAAYAKFVPLFTKEGYDVWMMDYPGFGKSTGELSEARLYAYSEQLYVLARSRFAADSIIIYGKSLGSGIAAWLASKKSCRRVILETPYYSMRSVVSHYFPIFPVSTLLKYNMPTYSYLSIINAPITIFHGTEDEVIPYSNAKRLRETLREKDEFVTIPGGGHNNLAGFPLFQDKLDSILGK